MAPVLLPPHHLEQSGLVGTRDLGWLPQVGEVLFDFLDRGNLAAGIPKIC